MSDGREERAEQEMRREEEKQTRREDWLDRTPLDEVDAWEPERDDS